MLERIDGDIVFHCDECSECLETGMHDFAKALALLKEEEWANVKDDDGEYTHVCPACLDGEE